MLPTSYVFACCKSLNYWQIASKLDHKVPKTLTLIRRLTRAEWKSIKSTGVIPYGNAVAVVVAPPLNRDPTTKMRPQTSVDGAVIQQGHLN